MIFEKTNSKISYCSVAFFTGLSLGAGPEKVVTATHLSQGVGVFFDRFVLKLKMKRNSWTV